MNKEKKMTIQDIYSVDYNNSFEEIDDCLMVVESSGENVFVLDENGKTLLKLFDGRKTIGEIIEQLKQIYDHTFIIDEFLEFVDELIAKGIIIKA